MKIFFYAMISGILFLPVFLMAQDAHNAHNAPTDNVLLNESFFTDGVYFTLSDLQQHKPSVSKEQLFKSTIDNSNFSIGQWAGTQNLFYFDSEGVKRKLSRDSLWGYVENGTLALSACCNENNNNSTYLLNDSTYTNYFSALDTLFSLADEAGLKVILLIRMHPLFHTTEIHFEKMAKQFKNTSALMAYDLFNEPLYFDTLEREKKDVYEIVNRWQKIKNEYAPHQLSTIGMTGVREVLEWDPNILNVDFLSFHPYEYEPNQVMSEIYWYGKYVKKPWMIGETGIPADNDSVSYDAQKIFAEKTLNQTYNCGGIGYSWWQFRDVNWMDFHQDFLGVVKRAGSTQLPDGNIEYGEAKPLNDVIKGFNSKKEKTNCVKPDNYYNYSRNDYYKIYGKLINEKGEPIEGGIILAWSEDWSQSYHSVSKSDGSFELYSQYPFYHWKASATNYSMVRGDINQNNVVIDNNGKSKKVNMGNLTLTPLNF
ncbi:MAG: hypothetical protein JSS90_10135 [Bacteroidetes bacterium]|nr:hypothetical protein [Bacteroidota bacterium]